MGTPLSVQNKSSLMLVSKILFSSVLLLWVLLYKIDWSEFKVIFCDLRLTLLVPAFLMNFLGVAISAFRWQSLLKGQQIYINIPPLVESYLIGSFFNLFMPTRVGGDLVRMVHLKEATKSLSVSASSIFAERLMGISVLFVFAFFSSILCVLAGYKIKVVWFGLLIGATGIASCLSLIYTNIGRFLIMLIPGVKIRKRVLRGWQLFQENIRKIFSDTKAVRLGVLSSLLLQVNVIIHFWLIGKSLLLPVPLIDYFFLIPVQLIILMFPSINGIGLREASSILLFQFYGIDSTSASLFGFIDLAMMMMTGVIGWLCFIRKGKPIFQNQRTL